MENCVFRRHPLLEVVVLMLAFWSSLPVGAQTPSRSPALPPLAPMQALPEASPPPSNLFRIGYLSPSEDSVLGQQWYLDMRQALLRDPEITALLREAGFADHDVALRPCNGAEDMLQRMNQMEFEVVFCPTMVYVRQRAAQPAMYPYHAFLQTRRQLWDSHAGEHVRQRGVLFVRRGSELDIPEEQLTERQVNRVLSRQFLAVSSRFDAAGYFDVRKMLWDNYENTIPGEVLFTGHSQEVVKSVVSGVCDIGACEESVLRSVFQSFPPSLDHLTEFRDGRNAFVRVIATTRGVPGDPVVIRDRLSPARPDGRLGQALSEFFRRYFSNSDVGAPILEVTTDAVYDGLVEDARRLQGVPW